MPATHGFGLLGQRRRRDVQYVCSGIADLANLTELDLDGNQFTDLPEVIGKLTSLRTLYLADNQLTVLPEAIGELTNLIELCLMNNQLTELPEAIGELTNLTMLYLMFFTAIKAAFNMTTKVVTLK